MSRTGRAEIAEYYGEKSLRKRIANTIGESFLIKFAIVGLGMILFGGVINVVWGSPTWSGVTAAAGLVVFVLNVLGYLLYKFLVKFI